jgi:hypothetical protein
MEPVGETLPNWPAALGDSWLKGPFRFNVQVIGGPNAAVTDTGETADRRRCRFINSPAFYAQIQT